MAESSNRQQAQMVISVNTPVHNPIQTIESFNKRFGLTLAEGEMVKASFAAGAGCRPCGTSSRPTRARQDRRN